MFKVDTLERKSKEIELNRIYTLDNVVLLTGLSSKTLRRHIKNNILCALLKNGSYKITGNWLKFYLYNLMHDTTFYPYYTDEEELPFELKGLLDNQEEEDELINLV
jgi:hypothetical protein